MQPLIVFGFALLACNHLGLHPEVAGTAPDKPKSGMSASARRKVSNACSISVKSKAAKRQKRVDRADAELRAAEERLRAVKELGDAATVLQAMKDRDSAATKLASIDPIDTKRLFTACKSKAAARAKRVLAERRLEQAEREREQEREQELQDEDEDAEAAERRRAALRALGEGLQRAGQPRPSYAAPIYTAPPPYSPSLTPAPINWTPVTTPRRFEEPVDQCTACIQQWCNFQCAGIGNDCASCMKQWCDFQC